MTKKAAKQARAEAPPCLVIPQADEIERAIHARFGEAAAVLANDEELRFRAYEDRTAAGEHRGYAIGFGRNMTYKGITKQEALLLYYNDLVEADERLNQIPEARAVKGPRRAVLLNLMHNLGLSGLQRFKRMLAALDAGDWERAAAELGDSKWFEDVPRMRSSRLIAMMALGKFPSEFTDAERGAVERAAHRNRTHYQYVLKGLDEQPQTSDA